MNNRLRISIVVTSPLKKYGGGNLLIINKLLCKHSIIEGYAKAIWRSFVIFFSNQKTPKIMKTMTMIAAALLCGVLFAGCDGEEGGGASAKLSGLKTSNLANTRAAFLTGGAATGARAKARAVGAEGAEDDEETKIYKVGIDDQTQAVTFTDQHGATVDAVVEYIQSLSQKFAIMRVHAPGESEKCVFVIRKSDGKLFTDDFTLANGYTGGRECPLDKFTWDGGVGDSGLDYSSFVEVGSDGDLYYLSGGYTLGGEPLNRIYEEGGEVRFSTTPYEAMEYWTFNKNGDVLGQIDTTLQVVWYDKNGAERARTGWFVNGGLQTPEIQTGTPFALACAPESFFTVDDIVAPSGGEWLRSVLAQYSIVEGEVVRSEVYTFERRVDFGPAYCITNNGVGVFSLLRLGAGSNKHEVCIITDPTAAAGVKYVTIGEGSNFYEGVNSQFNPRSNRYVYCGYGNPTNTIFPANVISRLDTQTATDTPAYYSLPAGYTLEWFTTSHDDVLTICALHSGKRVFIEVAANGTATINDTWENKNVILRTAF